MCASSPAPVVKTAFREVVSVAATDCRQLDQLAAGDVLMVTRLGRLARPVTSSQYLGRYNRSQGRVPVLGRQLGERPESRTDPTDVLTFS
jgi:hypothetical protein